MVGIDHHAAAGLLADGLRAASARLSSEVADQVWPMLNARQLKRFQPHVAALAAELERFADRASGSGGLGDAAAAVRELQHAAEAATGSKRALRSFARHMSTTADTLARAAPAHRLDELPTLPRIRELATADLTREGARELLDLLPTGIVDDAAAARLFGLEDARLVEELTTTARDIVARRASDGARERLGLIGLQLRRDDPVAADRIRALALDVFDAQPGEVPPAGWARLVDLLETDPAGAVLDGPRTAPDPAHRPLLEIAVTGTKQTSTARTSEVSVAYFDTWRDALRAAGVEPAGIGLDARRVLRSGPSDPFQDADLMGREWIDLSHAERMRQSLAIARHRLHVDPDAITTLLRELSDGPVQRIGVDDLRFFGAVAQLDDTVRPAWMHYGRFADADAWYRVAHRVRVKDTPNQTWAGFKHLAEWIDQVAIDDVITAAGVTDRAYVDALVDRRLDPAAAAELARITVLRTHLLPTDLPAPIRLEVLSLGPRLASDQLARHGTTPRAWLDAVVAAIEAAPPARTDFEHELATRIREVAEANLRRMVPKTSDTPNAFVDFAEVGAIGVDLRVLGRMLADPLPMPEGLVW